MLNFCLWHPMKSKVYSLDILRVQVRWEYKDRATIISSSTSGYVDQRSGPTILLTVENTRSLPLQDAGVAYRRITTANIQRARGHVLQFFEAPFSWRLQIALLTMKDAPNGSYRAVHAHHAQFSKVLGCKIQGWERFDVLKEGLLLETE